jgi:hypothetical protein
MLGVSWEVIEHTLSMKTGSKPVKQGLNRFDQETCKAIGEEFVRLLAAGFVKQVQHPDWIANPVLVPKKEWEMKDVY